MGDQREAQNQIFEADKPVKQPMTRNQFMSNLSECIHDASRGGIHYSEIIGALEFTKFMLLAPTILSVYAAGKPDEPKPKS